MSESHRMEIGESRPLVGQVQSNQVSDAITPKSAYGTAPLLPEGHHSYEPTDLSEEKCIGYLGSLAIAVNSLAGPAILQLPYQFQQSGLIPTTLCLLAVALLSATCSLHMANTVSKVPGNKDFDLTIEFSDAFEIFWGKTAYQATQILFFLTAICLNTAAIVDTAEVVDSVLGLHAESWAWSPVATSGSWWQFQSWSHPPCTRKQVKLGLCEPFSDETVYGDYLLTAGYLITAAVFVPVSLMDLKENTHWQIFGFFTLVTLSIYFCYEFATQDKLQQQPFHYSHHNYTSTHHHSHHHNHANLSIKNATWWGYEHADMLGVILFNFTLVMAIPAWLHSKRPEVSVHAVVNHSTCLATALYVAVGAITALAIPHVNINMLGPMISGAFGKGVQIAGSFFAFFIIGLDIPLFSVLARYNLTHSGLCSTTTANLLVVWIPWSLSWLFYQGDAVGELLNWGGVLLTSAIAFLLPLYLACRTLYVTDNLGSFHVYASQCWQSRKAQKTALMVILTLAVIAVTGAIGGQIYAQGARDNYLHSPEYLMNGTQLTGASLVDITHKHHRHHSSRGSYLVVKPAKDYLNETIYHH